ncbi:hypothetical protein E3O19_15345 [Cryobacterium algoritolerans]|uniref:Uncharacterized protein n=1 Tax=Cryobacterium algoritolerans TaxID=1259184 RepID=A0A4R8WIR0_9MICO|nr:hypothetical protein E3O19_15345 [Cryobacterium algoritolerans]
MAGSLAIAGGSLRRWPARRWWIALATAVGTYLVIAIPTDLIDTPLFARAVAPTNWSWPVLAVSAILSGLVFATYVAYPEGAAPSRSEGRLGLAGWMITFFAVGCPVCNKIVLLALGASGALQLFGPVQPYLAGASIILLGWALHARLSRESSCALTVVESTTESVLP